MANVTFTFDAHFNYAHPRDWSNDEIQAMKADPVGTVAGLYYSLITSREPNGGFGARADGAGVTLTDVQDVYIDFDRSRKDDDIHVTGKQLKAHVENALARMAPEGSTPLDTQSPGHDQNFINAGPFPWLDRDSLLVLKSNLTAIFQPVQAAPRAAAPLYQDPPFIYTTPFHQSIMGGIFDRAHTPRPAVEGPVEVIHVEDVEQRPEGYDGPIHIGHGG